MRIINLIENTDGNNGCEFAHGLSFYIETGKHKILVDLGPSDLTTRNAEIIGIDLDAVDIVILSHGHYDHSGGIIPFSKINSHATIYMQKTALGEYYSDDGKDKDEDRYRYIGVDKTIGDLPQVKLIDGDYEIDDELSLFVIKKREEKVPFTNGRLKEKKGSSYVQDEFEHEHYLVIRDDDRRILVSGCAHNGIVNIIKEYKKRYSSEPDAVISGFHLMKKGEYTDDELGEIIDTAKELKKYRTMFYTCHCTGVSAFEVMKNIMGDHLEYVHCGDEVKVQYYSKRRRDSFMKLHKFFAWATVACFLMTMFTGYKKQ